MKQYISLGVKLTKVHRVLEFSQAAFLKPYIDLNTAKRIQAKNDWEKHFYKLMNNAVFGKTLENLRNRVDVKLAHTEKKLNKLVAKSFLKRFEILNENLIIFEFEKVKLLLKRPIYIGQAVLDISKTIMYNFHYNYIKRKFGDRVQLCFTDTDSFLYDIKSVDVYEEIAIDKDLFDFSNYPNTHKLFDLKNKKMLGKFKDECGGNVIQEFVGLRSKLYSYRVKDVDICKAKGIMRNTISKEITLNHYKNCLFRNSVVRCEMDAIRSSKHQLQIERINKIAISAMDDKGYLCNDIETHAFGHCKDGVNISS